MTSSSNDQPVLLAFGPLVVADGGAFRLLATDKSRTGAHRFYERLGFAASHEGMKLAL